MKQRPRPGMHAHFRPRPDGKVDPAGEAGWYLQRERELRGISLEAAGYETGVHPHHLEAIEYGDLSRLPRRAETLRIIGHYTRYLGFDPKPVLKHYERLLPKEDGGVLNSAKIIPFPLMRRLKAMSASAGGAATSVLAVTLLFGGFVWMLTPSETPSGDMLEVAAEDTAPAPKARPAESVRTAAADKQPLRKSADRPRRVSALTRLTEEVLKDDADKKDIGGIAALIARTSKGLEPLPDSGAAGKRPQRLVLRAVARTSLRILRHDGSVLFDGTLQRGQTYTVPPEDGLTISTRDGHLLEWLVDGKLKGRLAAPRTVLGGESLKSLVKAPRG